MLLDNGSISSYMMLIFDEIYTQKRKSMSEVLGRLYAAMLYDNQTQIKCAVCDKVSTRNKVLDSI